MRSSSPVAHPSDVVSYYQSSQWLYRLFCYNDETLGMHFGFWEKGVKNRQDAIVAQHLSLAQFVPVKRGMRILDAGCGVGGSAISLAKNFNVNVVGITIDPHQVELACQNARRHGVDDRVRFERQDFCHTTFTSGSFDAVFAYESACYAGPKSQFLREASRLLKPGGYLLVEDGYMARSPQNPRERRLLEQFTDAFALPEVITGSQMTRQMKDAGFVRVRSVSKIREVRPSINYFWRLSTVMLLITWMSKRIPNRYAQAVYRNFTAVRLAGTFDRIGLADYRVHVGQKPPP